MKALYFEILLRYSTYLIVMLLFSSCTDTQKQTRLFVPTCEELNKPFGKHDIRAFKFPQQIYRPETWFHFIGGNVDNKGITADLEAISAAGFSGIQFFHGQFGGEWLGVDHQITCLSPEWNESLKHVGKECKRLGLKFTMQNCPGWAMSGGPWITPENAMRQLAASRTDIKGGDTTKIILPVPQPNKEEWRDYKDIAVLAFPTPHEDTDKPLKPASVESNDSLAWVNLLHGDLKGHLNLSPTTADNPHIIDITFNSNTKVRTIEFSSVREMNHGWCYEPGITVNVQAVFHNRKTQFIFNTKLPPSSWQDNYPVLFHSPIFLMSKNTEFRLSTNMTCDFLLFACSPPPEKTTGNQKPDGL
ncbi:MAG: hypothetical protein LBS55_13695 [Prevotellaceae bacterium]|jgi:hypothetical protein|nr:hypothetical protein [Prevotellaceae bacterium]